MVKLTFTTQLKSILTSLILTIILVGCHSTPPANEYVMILPDTTTALTAKNTSSTPTRPTLIVGQIRVDSVFDDRSIYYQREIGKIEHFTVNRWVTNPSRMLQPIFVKSLEATNAFSAVIPMPSDTIGQNRLDITLTRLHLNYLKNDHSAQLAFRVRLTDLDSGKLLYSRTYETQVALKNSNPQAGVDAINSALAILVPQIVSDVINAQ